MERKKSRVVPLIGTTRLFFYCFDFMSLRN